MAINFDHHTHAAKMGAEIEEREHQEPSAHSDGGTWYWRWTTNQGTSWFGPFESIGDAYEDVYECYCEGCEAAANDHQSEE